MWVRILLEFLRVSEILEHWYVQKSKALLLQIRKHRKFPHYGQPWPISWSSVHVYIRYRAKKLVCHHGTPDERHIDVTSRTVGHTLFILILSFIIGLYVQNKVNSYDIQRNMANCVLKLHHVPLEEFPHYSKRSSYPCRCIALTSRILDQASIHFVRYQIYLASNLPAANCKR